ncbi:MAG TPA: DegT/DnrJ/EryC1/StrS family aminotransferase, partial [Candidatus Saccharimonadales bacterium]|nr:DegT/DnrJ/EryC1/StrS family aminotransferase [Candidatus Saccharimonadales bacterium]
KILLVFLQNLHLLSFPYTQDEKKSKIAGLNLQRMPDALAKLALFQLKKINRYNKRREEIVKLYSEQLGSLGYSFPSKNTSQLMRFVIFHPKRDDIYNFFRKRGVYLGKWYSVVIEPKGTDLKKIYYDPRSCPNAAALAKTVLQLPTYPTMKLKDAQRIIDQLIDYATHTTG